jgi:hypothetical protein
VITDSKNNVVRTLKVASGKGFHRTAWNLRYGSSFAIWQGEKNNGNKSDGFIVPQGTYSATLYKRLNGIATQLDEPVIFEVESLYKSSIAGKTKVEKDAFEKEYIIAVDQKNDLMNRYGKQKRKVETLHVAAQRVSKSFGEVDAELHALDSALLEMEILLTGSASKAAIGEKDMPSLNDRIWAAGGSLYGSTYGPSGTAIASLSIANEMLADIEQRVTNLDTQINTTYEKLRKLGAPVIRGIDK